MEPNEIARRIEKAFPGATADVKGADNHYSARIVSDRFEGKSRIEQHRMIYDLFQEEMASQDIHALALKTLTPAQAADESNR
ncbi:MAG TPA: BolA family protein [Candidatus Polarisedimenticolia bacterium]|nr:BolA family protein [Candidatus Polarisedimenticolia bacterium]